MTEGGTAFKIVHPAPLPDRRLCSILKPIVWRNFGIGRMPADKGSSMRSRFKFSLSDMLKQHRRWEKTIAKAVKAPENAARIEGLGIIPVGGTPAELTATMRADQARWGAVIKAKGIRLD